MRTAGPDTSGSTPNQRIKLTRQSVAARRGRSPRSRPTEPGKTKGVSPLAANDEVISGPFYHGTKADLTPGDLITPG
jgi:hypothetical protein